jgi:GT2 family glycosyltransferase
VDAEVESGDHLPKVSIVVLNYNTHGLVLDCLRSMRNLRIPDFEVVLLDNGSREFDPGPFAEAWPGLVIRTVADNLGPARGYNEAVEASSGEYVLLLDSDTLFPEDNRVEELVAWLDAHPGYAAAAPLTVDAHGVVDPWQAVYFPAVWRMVASVPARVLAERVPRLRPLLGRVAVNLGPLADRDVDATCFAATLVRRSCFDAVGGFSTEYFMYYEDTDLSKKFQVRNWRIRWVVGARVVHLGGGSSTASPERDRRYVRSQEIYFRKWKGRTGVWLLRLVRLPFRVAPALERWQRVGPAADGAPGRG